MLGSVEALLFFFRGGAKEKLDSGLKWPCYVNSLIFKLTKAGLSEDHGGRWPHLLH